MTPRLYIAKSGARQAPSLPVDAVTRTIAVLGQRGTGKTNTAVVICEEIARRGGHVAILDPVGAWYGITRKGEKQGIPGIVLGGEYGDVPLEEGAGTLVAELVVGRHYPVVVIDMKLLRKGAQLRFMADYLEALFHANREPLMQVFEEADRALPQTGRNFDVVASRVLGAGEDIIKLGRSRGLGGMVVTQRTASVNKNVLEVCEALALHRLMGPNDRKSVKGWVESNGDPAALKIVMDSMASLKQGEVWLYAPGWLGEELPATRRPDQPAAGLVRLRMRKRHTFDSSRTPELGEVVVEPTARAPVDLDELRTRMAETVQRQRENDPRELRKRIAELERQLAEQPEPERVEVTVAEPVPVIPDGLLDAAVQTTGHLEASASELRRMADSAEKMREWLHRALDDPELPPVTFKPSAPAGGRAQEQGPPADGASLVRPAVPPSAPRSSNGGVSSPKRRVLNGLAWLETVGIAPASRLQLAMIAGYHERTKGFTNALGEMRTDGWIDYPMPGTVALADAGRKHATPPPTPPTTRDLHAMVRAQVGETRWRILEVLIAKYPDAVLRSDLAEQLGYHERTKGFTSGLGSLRSLGLIDYPAPGSVHALPVLFLEDSRAAVG